MAKLLRGVALIITLSILATLVGNVSAHTAETLYLNQTNRVVSPNDAPSDSVAAAGLFYYVATGGNDSNPGTQAQPFRTINRGVSVLRPGDTLLVGAGTYNEYINNSIPSGSSWTSPVTVQASPRNSVTIKPPSGSDRAMTFDGSTQYVIVDGFILDGTNAGIDTLKFQGATGRPNPNHIRIINSEIKNAPRQGILVSQGDQYIELINLVVHDNGSTDFDHGMYIQGDHILIQGCTIYSNAGWGIHIYGGAPSNITVVDNKIHDNARLGLRGFGIGVYTGDSNQIYNNVIWGKNQGGIDIGRGITNAGIYNNTVANNRESGITILSSSTSTTLRNNLVMQSGSGLVNNGVGTIMDHNFIGDPQFMNAGAADFHLKAGSPAINVGTTISTVTTDFDGVPRPQSGAYDAGAFEYNSGLAPSATPSNTPLPSATPSKTPLPTSTGLPSATSTKTPLPTSTGLPSATPSNTPQSSATPTNTPVVSATPSNTPLPSATSTNTPVPTGTPVNPPKAIDTIGVFRPSRTAFYLRNSNTSGAPDITATFGTSTDLPVVGDWNGDGIDTLGVYRNGLFLLTNSNAANAAINYSIALGQPGDLPVIGDWDGNGKDGIGVFRPSTGMVYLKNYLVSGFASYAMQIGVLGDLPVAGDWDGNGKDSPGVFRPSTATFRLTNAVCNCTVSTNYTVQFGQAGDSPVTGDWNGDGITGLGVFHPSNGVIALKNTLSAGAADTTFSFGQPSDAPVAGHWSAASSTSNETPIPPTPKLAPTFVP
ncbi:MAG: right-handed parallel beta-helix repeat-containing protein [Chloroflexota bacterium]